MNEWMVNDTPAQKYIGCWVLDKMYLYQKLNKKLH